MKKHKITVLLIFLLASCEIQEQSVNLKKEASIKPSALVSVIPSINSTALQSISPALKPVAIPTPKPRDPKKLPETLGNEKKTKICEGKLTKPQGIETKSGKLYITTINEKPVSGGVAGEIKIFDTEGYYNSTISISNPFMEPLPTELIGVASNGFNIWVLNKSFASNTKKNLYSFDTNGANYKDYAVGQSTSEFTAMTIYPSISNSILYLFDAKNKSIIKASFTRTSLAEQKTDFIKDLNVKGMAVDSSGNLLVCSGADNSFIITSYDKDAKAILSFSLIGKNNAGFSSVSSVSGIAYDARNGGTIYALVKLSNELGSIILRFNSKGDFLGYFGEDANMSNPASIVVERDGSIYVLDTAKSLIYRFTPANKVG